MKTTAALLLAAGTFGMGLLAGRLLFHGDEVCKIDASPAPAVRAEPARIADPEPLPELERPDSRLAIMPAPPPQPGEASPLGDQAVRALESNLDQASRLTLTPTRELAAQARALQLTPPDPRNPRESVKDAVLIDQIKQVIESMERVEPAGPR